MNLEGRIKQQLSIPKYFNQYVRSDYKLEDKNNSIPCPWHKEKTPSWSYSKTKGLWRCWGECKVGGDVITLHQVNEKLDSRAEAIESLAVLLKIENELTTELPTIEFKVDEITVELKTKMIIADKLCKSSKDYIELDFIMSKFQHSEDTIKDLDTFINKRV